MQKNDVKLAYIRNSLSLNYEILNVSLAFPEGKKILFFFLPPQALPSSSSLTVSSNFATNFSFTPPPFPTFLRYFALQEEERRVTQQGAQMCIHTRRTRNISPSVSATKPAGKIPPRKITRLVNSKGQNNIKSLFEFQQTIWDNNRLKRNFTLLNIWKKKSENQATRQIIGLSFFGQSKNKTTE